MKTWNKGILKMKNIKIMKSKYYLVLKKHLYMQN